MVRLLETIRERQDEQKLIRQKYKPSKPFNENNLVFCTKLGTPLNFSEIQRRVIQVGKESGIDKIHIHCLRHTFASRGLENGIPLRVMQELLGHATLKMTADTYTHVLPDMKKDSIMKLEGTIKF